MSNRSSSPEPTQVIKKIEEAKAILRDIGLPPAQQNQRSALTLLALLNLKVDTPWTEAMQVVVGSRSRCAYYLLPSTYHTRLWITSHHRLEQVANVTNF